MTILPVLLTLAAIPAYQFRFLQVLLPLWLAIPGRINARSFSRYSGWNERSGVTLPRRCLGTLFIWRCYGCCCRVGHWTRA